MSEHTRGPLEVEYDRHAGYDCMSGGFEVKAKDGGPFGGSFVVFDCAAQGGEALAKANAHRMVACWNNCEGINPEAVPELLGALSDLARLHDCGEGADCMFYRTARAAIAKAESHE